MPKSPARGALIPGTASRERARCYRACDRRFPFLWSDDSQEPARWHGDGEGPCHYLATTADGAWAEVLRHRDIHELDELLDLELAIWELEVPMPTARPNLDPDLLTGDASSYPACRDEARRLRAAGHDSLRAPAAALVSGAAALYGVAGGEQVVVGSAPNETFVFFGVPDELVGAPIAEGHPEPAVLEHVRSL
jgi:hypothetical protein